MNFCPHTQEDIKEMCSVCNVNEVDDLFKDLPVEEINFKKLGKGISEHEGYNHILDLAKKNNLISYHFIGAGLYDHIIPSVVDFVASRSEFYTAYTPYQPECSQGTLQALFEYQTAICNLTDLEVTNASLYDGGTALAEAVLMSLRITRREKIIMDKSVNPIYRNIVKTYLKFLPYELIEVETNGIEPDFDKIKFMLDSDVACFVFQNPTFYGSVHDWTELVNFAHEKGILAVSSVYPISLGIVKTPGQMGVDIATGEGQSLGNPLSFGGPYFGFLVTKKAYIRNMPGRIVGETLDRNNKKAYVLTLQAREQHIKRHRATSNICSNEGLCALRALVYLCSLGKNGLKELAQINFSKSEYMKKKLIELGLNIKNNATTFNEFVVEFNKPAKEIFLALLSKNIAFGVPLYLFGGSEKDILINITEKMSKEKIDNVCSILEAML
ncbi:glycine dehydrogenase (decarboxylating) subunit 1 [Thermodesulfobium narugense DSM 14796]|uniref:Probable glycine dehydrogenase (decarboxylating) subunit 1 n=1 Tax=Thermodesulfobium narugense DSM 14796 TaxID=747365 RepID=M1E6F1_9BACT|nr:aminomethyl-transferring glycine dehydrogenase subunit GcvPA [Thermodesulfobium narugense]AEE14771.1 glycine dehydrogenase (decarboxylating) subunit 1 [Thermodesulfobium narugense DSM 14796]